MQTSIVKAGLTLADCNRAVAALSGPRWLPKRLHRRLTRSGTDMAALAAVGALDLVRRDGEEDELI